MKRFFKRLLALALCGGMLLVSAPAAFAEESIDDLNDRYKQLQAEADALQAIPPTAGRRPAAPSKGR